jgi:hypothetical protein
LKDINVMSPSSGRFVDDEGNVHNVIERVTGAKTTINSDHRAIHKGEGFGISGIFVNVANGATVNYAFKTPTVASGKYVHLKYNDISAAGNKIRVDLFEAPTNAPTLGSDLSTINRRRVGTPAVSNMQAVKSAMTIDTTGAVTLETKQFISGQTRPIDIEFVLKPDTWYIRTFTNSTGSASDISFFEFWYEEDLG